MNKWMKEGFRFPEVPFGAANSLYKPGMPAKEFYDKLAAHRGPHLGGLKAVAAQAFMLVDEYAAVANDLKGRERLIALKGKTFALKIALEACQQKTAILMNRKRNHRQKKDDPTKAPPSLIEARKKMAQKHAREKNGHGADDSDA